MTRRSGPVEELRQHLKRQTSCVQLQVATIGRRTLAKIFEKNARPTFKEWVVPVKEITDSYEVGYR